MTEEAVIPSMKALRRVPACYRRMLPLSVMKRYQCTVVGCEDDTLTLAVTDQCDTSWLELLSRGTGYKIFPVLVDVMQMHLLLRRIESIERKKQLLFRKNAYDYPLQIRTALLILIAQCS